MSLSRIVCDHRYGSAYCPACASDRDDVPLGDPVPNAVSKEFVAARRRRRGQPVDPHRPV